MRRTAGEQALEMATLWRSVVAGDITTREYLQMVQRLLSEVPGVDGLVDLVTAQASLTSRALAAQQLLPDLTPDGLLQAMALSEEASRP